MLRFLYLITALSTALIPFLPEVAVGLPLDAEYNGSLPTTFDSISNPYGVIVSPNRYPSGGAYPINNYGTVIVNPSDRYSRGAYPINNYGTVIVDPNNANSSSRRSNCGLSRIGNPIPSPVPVNLYTGRFC